MMFRKISSVVMLVALLALPGVAAEDPPADSGSQGGESPPAEPPADDGAATPPPEEAPSSEDEGICLPLLPLCIDPPVCVVTSPNEEHGVYAIPYPDPYDGFRINHMYIGVYLKTGGGDC